MGKHPLPQTLPPASYKWWDKKSLLQQPLPDMLNHQGKEEVDFLPHQSDAWFIFVPSKSLPFHNP